MALKKLPVRKLNDANGKFYPLSAAECVLTTHDIEVKNDIGCYEKGDIIPKETNLDNVLTNLLSFKSKVNPIYTDSDVFRIVNEYTAFEVHPTNTTIPAGVLDEDTGLAYKVSVPPQMTEVFNIRTMQPLNMSNVIIDWGDDTITKLNEEESKSWSDIAGEEDGVHQYFMEEKEYMNYCWHTYETPGKYIIKIYGNTYWGLRSELPEYCLTSRVFDCDLPLARWCTDLCNFAKGSLRLQQIYAPNYYWLRSVQNTTHSFQNCYNLLKVQNFRKLPWCNNSYAINSAFQGCNNLEFSDMKIPSSNNTLSSGWHDFYNGCSNLDVDVLTLLPDNGFGGRYVNMSNVFLNCAKLKCSNYEKLAEILWDDTHIIWKNTNNCFSGCSSLDLTKIPVAWGGTLRG